MMERLSKRYPPMFIAQIEYEVFAQHFTVEKIRRLLQTPFNQWTTDERICMFTSLKKILSGRKAWILYRQRVRSLTFNLLQSPEVAQRWADGECTVKWLVGASSRELWPARWVTKRNRQLGEAVEESHTTTEFYCPKCGQRKCTYFQKQTRSADEPMTTFVQCTVCPNRWKFG